MQDPAVPPCGDDPMALRVAAAGVVVPLTAIEGTAARLRGQWLALATMYRAAEADRLLRAMDGPREEAAELLRTGWALHRALCVYAERLEEIEAWTRGAGPDLHATGVARQRAQEQCAAAIAALALDRRTRRTKVVAVPSTVVAASPRPSGPGATAPASSITPGSLTPGSLTPRGGTDTEASTWLGLRPPGDGDGLQRGFYALEMAGLAASTHASWMVSVEHGTFRPRAESGRFLSAGSLTPAQRLLAGAGRFSTASGLSPLGRLTGFQPGGNIIAKPHRGTAHARWSRTASALGRSTTGLTIASTGWSQWQRSAGEATDRRIGRTATRTATTAGGAWAGGQAGAWAGGAIGTAVLPGAGTVVGATVGGLLGGFAGSEAGSWVGEQLADAGSDAGEVVGDGVGWAADHAEDVGGDVVDTLSFWQ